MAKKISLFVFLLFQFFLSNSQVKLQTGAPEINFPLYSVTDANNRLNAGVSLTYTGGNGINVDDPGSYVGTGWDLNYGGFISRQQVGEPDDQKQTGLFNVFGLGPSVVDPAQSVTTNLVNSGNAFSKYVDKYFPNGYVYSEYSPFDGISDGGAYSYTAQREEQSLQPPKYIADRQIDVFSFNLSGRTGKFLIGRDNNRTLLFLNQADAKLKIQIQFDESMLTQGMRTTIKGFTVTDESGIQYVFQDMELTEVIKYTSTQLYNMDGTQAGAYTKNIVALPSDPVWISSTSNFNYNSFSKNFFKVYKGTRTGQYVCNKWMLTRIVNPLTQKTIEFNYTTEEVVTEGSHSAIVSSLQGQSSLNVYISMLSSKIKKPSTIYNQYGDKIEFIYGASRQDISGNKVLSKINFYKNSHWVSDMEFSYGYFYKNIIRNFTDVFTTSELPYLRLCLQQFQKAGQNNSKEPPCLFTYYTGTGQSDIVPPMFTFYKDFWGYYNEDNGYFPYYNDALAAPANGSIYPYSIYSQHAIWANTNYGFRLPELYDPINNPNLLVTKNGLIKTITYPTGGSLSYSYEPCYVLNNGVNTRAGGVRVKNIVSYDNINILNNLTTNYSYLLSDGSSSSGWGYTVPVNLEQRLERFYNLNNGISTTNSSGVVQSFFRVTDAIGVKGAAKKEVLNFISGASCSYEIVIVYILELLYDLFSSPPDQYTDYTVPVYFSEAINFNNPLPQMYSRVEVKQVNSNDQNKNNGKTVYNFTSPIDYPIEEPNDILLHSMKQRYGYWRYGLLKTKEIYNNTDPINPVYQTVNTYSADPTVYNTSQNYYSQNWMPNRTISISHPYYSMIAASYPNGVATYVYPIDNPDPCLVQNNVYQFSNGNILIPGIIIPNNIQSVGYSPFTGKVNLLQTVETSRDNNGNIQTNTTSFNYNIDNFLVSKIQYKSGGEKVETGYTYSNDYSFSSGAPQILKANNNITAPVLTENYIYPNGVDKYLLSGSINEYAVTGNNDIKVVNVYDFRSSSPVINTALQPFSNTQIVRDPNYYKLIKQIGYDNNGTLNQIISEGNKTSSTIYDDSSPDFLWAKVSNAKASDIAYTSFETNGSGNWGFGLNMVTSVAGGVTGKQAYDLNGGMWNNNLDPNKTYTLTFWVNGPKPGINKVLPDGSTQIIDPQFNYLLSVGNWSLISGQISGAKGIGIWKYGNQPTSYLDEVRLYPTNAQMVTYTYDPIVGMTAQSDLNNTTTYYEYDDLGRLKDVRDRNMNIVKEFEYKYQASVSSTATASLFSITAIDNTTNTGYTVILTSVSNSSLQYSFTVNAGSNSLGPVSPGTYNILITPPAGTSGLMGILSQSGVNNLYSSGPTSSFSNIVMGSTGYNTINIY